ncbi:MAG TPA: phosphotransferase [Micromonosporaceae bacterium]|nr:phosphotransferase [Micromonosporaceae bacterium]
MRSPPDDLAPDAVREAVAAGWSLRAVSMAYVPEGGGAHHWKLIDSGGESYFVTVDDLDSKNWIADTRDLTFDGLERVFGLAVELRDSVGLEFVLAPVPATDGRMVRRLDDRYGVSVFPFLAGHSFPFGQYTDDVIRNRAIDMVAALHRATPAVHTRVPVIAPGFAGRSELDAFLAEPERPWDGGPYAESTRRVLAQHTVHIAQLVAGFDGLVDATASGRAEPVITHGEPHPANLLSVNGRLLLIDWDTVGLAQHERDVSLIVGRDGAGMARYVRQTGRQIDPSAMTLYRLRWYLDDLASAVRMFRQPHLDSAETRRWSASVAPELHELPIWLNRLA